MHPSNEIEREYAVRVRGELHARAAGKLSRAWRSTTVGEFDSIEPGAHRIEPLVPGRAARRAQPRGAAHVEALGVTVSRLMRVRFGPFACHPGCAAGNGAS